ncbi:hypothetical protein [Kitasatospora sp. NPDC057015]|uniref:hypothetical protein n=1 Tax=Kitasatospora sp. NPDC057015 TaxID=3346001 RepID=UPI00362A5486
MPIAPVAATGDPDQQARCQLAADAYRALAETDQAEIMRTVATCLTETSPALARQNAPEQIGTVLTERRRMTTEATRSEQPLTEERCRRP